MICSCANLDRFIVRLLMTDSAPKQGHSKGAGSPSTPSAPSGKRSAFRRARQAQHRRRSLAADGRGRTAAHPLGLAPSLVARGRHPAICGRASHLEQIAGRLGQAAYEDARQTESYSVLRPSRDAKRCRTGALPSPCFRPPQLPPTRDRAGPSNMVQPWLLPPRHIGRSVPDDPQNALMPLPRPTSS